jgi:GH24 family phage-related lysozyme (muramidase)
MTQKKKYVVALAVAIAIYIIMDSKKSVGKPTYAQIQDQLFNYLALGWEKFSPRAKWDFAQYSIGYGEGWNWDKNRKVEAGDVIDEPTARRWFMKSAEKYYNYVADSVKVPVNENQMVAMTSLTYNIGPGSALKGTGFKGSQLLKDLNAGKPLTEVAKGFDRYTMAKDTRTGIVKVLPGLVRRRNSEKALFLKA